MSDISSVLSNAGLKLEKNAIDRFGAAVENFSRQSIPVETIQGASSTAESTSTPGEFNSLDYAHYAFQNSQTNAPKLHFNFKVEFELAPAYQQVLSRSLADKSNFTFFVKQIDRPKTDYEYEEVNYYNFRTKVLRSIKHRDMNMSMYDDVGNAVMDFYNIYRMAHSPISRRDWENNTTGFEVNGLNFSQSLSSTGMVDDTGLDTSMRSFLAGNTITFLRKINIYQVFMAETAKVVKFSFFNPRILSLDLDELTHENSESSGLTLSFDYDALYVSEAQNVDQPIKPIFAGTKDLLGDTTAIQAYNRQVQAVGPSSKSLSVDASINASTVFGTSATDATFGVLSGSAGGNLFTAPIGGQLAEASIRTLSTITKSPNQAFAKPGPPPLSDSTRPPSAPSTAKVFTSSGLFNPEYL